MSLANNKILKSAWTEFIYNGHLQSLGAVAIVFASITLVLNTLPTLDILVAAYCIFQVIFVYDRYRDLKIDSSTNKIRTDHLKKHYSKIPYELGLISVVGLIVILYYSNPLTLVISITIVLLGILYTFKIKDITKRLLMFKNVYVSAVFAIMVLYPYLFYGIYALPNPILIYLIVLVFVESMVSQIVLDIKDILDYSPFLPVSVKTKLLVL